MPGVANWVSNVRMKLFQDGFESVWMNQGVGRVREFIRAFREKVVDSRWQNWEDRVQTSDRISMYRSFNSIELKKSSSILIQMILVLFALALSIVSSC